MKSSAGLFSAIAIVAATFSLSLSQEKLTAAVPKSNDAFTATVPASGTNTVIVPITKWGRYSLRCSGVSPVSFSVSDRRSGYLAGCEGDSLNVNPRVDLFLDIGEYKLTVKGNKKARGKEIITATPFAYPPDFQPAFLVPRRENRLALDDF